MKKILIGILVSALLATASVYLFIPENITVISEMIAGASAGSAQRVTGISEYRTKWFPKEARIISPIKYVIDGCTYQFSVDNSFNDNIIIQYKNTEISSLLTIVAYANDSVNINWRLNRHCGYNPFNRISYYFNLKHIKTTNEKMLLALQLFLSNTKNVYGFNVNRHTQQDSTLITLKAFSTRYPDVEEIYKNIEKLKQYAAARDANATNAPMFNIVEKDPSGKWMYMVALPIDKALEDKGDIIAKRMFAGGKILITDDITGGTATINNAMQNFEKYKTDYGYMSPAIPFQSMVTDRMKESDTAKWQTKLYYPVY